MSAVGLFESHRERVLRQSSVEARLAGRRILDDKNETYYKFEIRDGVRLRVFFVLIYNDQRVLLNNVFESVPLTENDSQEIYYRCCKIIDRMGS